MLSAYPPNMETQNRRFILQMAEQNIKTLNYHEDISTAE
ncbi:hypothetical protein SAMN00777080_3046 [Aquiflexum balticum DSM 16537]|uniref:Uncharacterized protein n=1 Tax=Aquiflexum balticum DSM 16537 TaxID=758820 RepID=A0A1W2H675_9BACT|nr:hypothetical protein SAMN00777080_3046 [Aquiflexum balticum DSM 16537]